MAKKIKAYFVEYNGKYVGIYKTLRGAFNFVQKKGLKDDESNSLRVFDDKGNHYNPYPKN